MYRFPVRLLPIGFNHWFYKNLEINSRQRERERETDRQTDRQRQRQRDRDRDRDRGCVWEREEREREKEREQIYQWTNIIYNIRFFRWDPILNCAVKTLNISVTYFVLSGCKLDLIFLDDGSSSICEGSTDPFCPNWKSNLEFIKNIISSLTIGPDDTKVAYLKYGDQTDLRWNLDG